jgi:hypothetical protein
MEMNGVLSGCSIYKNKEVGFFAFEPIGNIGESVLRVIVDSNWHMYTLEPKWNITGMAGAKYNENDDWVIVASSSEGNLWELTPGNKLQQELKIEGDYSGITKLATIENFVWDCGMDRLLLKREFNGVWNDYSAPKSELNEGVIGFTAIGNSIEHGIIAVGWKGEIWSFKNQKWKKQITETQENLNAISVEENGKIIVVGDNETIILGENNIWTKIKVLKDINLQGVCHFKDEIFVCSDFEIFKLENNKLIPENRFDNGDLPKTTLNLFTGQNVVYSQGENDVFMYSDNNWKRKF